MTVLSFLRFSSMISALVFPLIPKTLAPSVANHQFLRWMSRLTTDPLGRLFAVVLVSLHVCSVVPLCFPVSVLKVCVVLFSMLLF